MIIWKRNWSLKAKAALGEGIPPLRAA